MPKFRLNIGTFVVAFVLSGVAGDVYMIFVNFVLCKSWQ